MSTTSLENKSRWPVWLCWLAMVLDGFDLVVLGTVIPTLIKTQDLGFDAVGATFAATISLVGVGLGALFIAPLSDRFGRRNLLVACVTWFSIFTIAVVFAPNVAVFSTFRLLAGLGLGACLPAALAYMNDYAPAGSAGKSTTRTMTGYHAGAVATAFLALMVIPDWRVMFVVGGVAGFVLVPFLWFKLPETLPAVVTLPAAAKPATEAAKEAPAGRTRQLQGSRQEAVSPRCRRYCCGLLHGTAAGLRTEHLAAAADVLRRVHAERRPFPPARPERGRCRRPGGGRHPGRQARNQEDRAALVRSFRRLPRCAQREDPERTAPERCRLRDRGLRLQLPGTGLRLGQPAVPGPAARHRTGLRRGRRSSRCHPGPCGDRYAGGRRNRLPLGLLRLRGAAVLAVAALVLVPQAVAAAAGKRTAVGPS